jgi:hypothetical protein
MIARTADPTDFTIDRMQRLRRVAAIARLMDTAVAIPFTSFRFGADSILGLVPGVGDAAGALVSLYIVNEARRLGVPANKLGLMVANIAVDTVGGSVPVIGDLFDVYFKSNRRNLQILLDHFQVSHDDLRRSRRY